MIFKPRDYQQKIVDKIRAGNAFIIALMGSGKTAATLEALRTSKAKRVLIIAPLRVAEHQWPSEIHKWDNFQHFEYSVATGALAKRKKAVESNRQITIINRENVPWLVEHWDKKWPYDVVIIDESSSFKNPSSKRFKALRKVRKLTKRWVMLTGTPAPNSLMELWPQVFMLDGGERLGTAFGAFQRRYFESDYMGYKWEPRKGTSKLIQDKIADLCEVVESYSGLTDKVDLINDVELPKRAMDEYRDFEQHAFMAIDEAEVSAVNAAVLAGKLAQMAGGAVYDIEGEWQSFHNEKLDELETILEGAESENILVAYNYKHEFERIMARFPHAVSIKEEGAIDRWNHGRIKLLLAHPASAGHGLNLWEGGNRIVWFSPTWSTELKLQFDARLHRQGQTKPVFVHTIMANGTIDADIVDAVTHKRSVQDMLIDRIKAHRGSV